jgi:ubiquinone/menaquinone biosynthesis C-methylase UbiE
MKLNVCCGDDYREGYINIDFSDIKSNGDKIKVDLMINVLNGLPYSHNSVDEIVFRESLEHFNRWDGLKILKELYRVLKPEGILDLTVPPAIKQMRIFLACIQKTKIATMDDFFNAHQKFTIWKWHDDLVGATNPDKSFGDSHLTFYTEATLKPIIEHVGFKIIFINDKIHIKAIK